MGSCATPKVVKEEKQHLQSIMSSRKFLSPYFHSQKISDIQYC